ncbi:MAG: hypothetical protein WDW36_004743 [Sanguina aurantia]
MPAAAASAKADITSVMLRDIVAAAGRHMFSLSGEPDAAATLLWSLAQLGHTGYRERGQGGSAVESLVHVVATAAAAQHRAGAGTTHASPTTDGQPHELTMGPTRVVMAVWAIAKLGCGRREVWEALMPLVMALPGLRAREVANVMWALATARHCDTGPFNVFASRAVNLLADCNGQDLSNMVWAMAHAAQPHPPLLAGAQAALLHLPPHQLTGQHAANLMWAFATLDTRIHPPLLSHLALVARMRAPGHMTGGHLAQILWSAVHLGVCDEALLSAAASGLTQAMQAGGVPQRQVCMVAWAAASVGLTREDGVHGPFVREVQRALQGGDASALAPQGVVMALWSLAKTGGYDQDLFDRLAACMMRNVYQYEAQQLSMVLWALATTHHLSSPAAVSAAAVSVETILPNLKPQRA